MFTKGNNGLFYFDYETQEPSVWPIANSDEDQLAICMIIDVQDRLWVTSTSGVSVVRGLLDSITVLPAVGLPESDYWQNGASKLPNGNLVLHLN